MSIKWQDFLSERTRFIGGSQIRQFFALTEKPEVISFAGGFPDTEFFPLDDISASLERMVRQEGHVALQYGPTEGSIDLRGLLAQKMFSLGMSCSINNLIITDGSQQGLDLIGRMLVDEGEAVLVEEPAYIGGMSAFKSYGGVPVGVAMDAEGPLPPVMDETVRRLIAEGNRPKIFYTVPNFQNPTGVTTSLERRREILKIASRYNLLIVEDNPYGDLCYEGEVPPCYKSMDTEGRVIYLGSFSKVLIPGIRVGWMVGPEELIENISLAKQTADLCSGTLGQQMAYHLTREGLVDRHIKKLTSLYRPKRDAMVAAMKKHFPPGVKFSRPTGGFFIWVTFPDYYPGSRDLLQKALGRNVAFVHGEGFSSNGGGDHSARFSFSQPSIEDINRGIRTLGELLHEIEAESTLKAVGQ